MQLEIISPDKVLFSGEVVSIVLPGEMGYFEILNHHAPIIALLAEGKIKYTLVQKEVKEILIKKGFVEVNNNKVIVLV